MKRIALLAVIGAGLMALPSTAAAQSGSTCTGTTVNGVTVGVSPSKVCVHAGGAGGELVVNPGGCSYVNGWETNPGTPGYAGLCTGADSRDAGCNPDGHAEGPNTGGCFAIKPPAPAAVNDALNTFPVGLVTATFICGNTTGEDPQKSKRRGCAIP